MCNCVDEPQVDVGPGSASNGNLHEEDAAE